MSAGVEKGGETNRGRLIRLSLSRPTEQDALERRIKLAGRIDVSERQCRSGKRTTECLCLSERREEAGRFFAKEKTGLSCEQASVLFWVEKKERARVCKPSGWKSCGKKFTKR